MFFEFFYRILFLLCSKGIERHRKGIDRTFFRQQAIERHSRQQHYSCSQLQNLFSFFFSLIYPAHGMMSWIYHDHSWPTARVREMGDVEDSTESILEGFQRLLFHCYFTFLSQRVCLLLVVQRKERMKRLGLFLPKVYIRTKKRRRQT